MEEYTKTIENVGEKIGGGKANALSNIRDSTTREKA